jgi:acyl-CoA reductase-like NAD-dependent aldehyde dehydrogenase
VPNGVFNVITGYGVGTGKKLVEHPLVAKIDVTVGSDIRRLLRI